MTGTALVELIGCKSASDVLRSDWAMPWIARRHEERAALVWTCSIKAWHSSHLNALTARRRPGLREMVERRRLTLASNDTRLPTCQTLERDFQGISQPPIGRKLPTMPMGTPQPSRVTVKLKQQLICRPVLTWPGLEVEVERFLSRRVGGVSVHVVKTALRDLSKPTER